MIVYVVAIIVVFVLCVMALMTLRLNKNQISQLVYYQYNYIPDALTGLVKVHKLKKHEPPL
ncbi:per os infectivity factor 7 [Orgyia pseudotsugata single capsid nuclopolyhedrovirus]|nr:per os infectivity factor 7 [Orgyia pseudotsugata single capsid nuclopolyhedrovirus]